MIADLKPVKIGHGNKARRRMAAVRRAWLKIRLSEFKKSP
jgi:hypothetical protein